MILSIALATIAAIPALSLYVLMCVMRPPLWWLSDMLVLSAAVLAASLLARSLSSLPALISFAIAAGIADFVSFTSGVTKKIIAAHAAGSTLLQYLSISVPLPGVPLAPLAGIADLFILGVLCASMHALGWRRASLFVPAAGLLVAAFVGLAVGGICAVPFMSAAVIAYALLARRHAHWVTMYRMRTKLLLLCAIPVAACAWPVVIHYRLPDALRADAAAQATAAIPPDAALDKFRADFYKIAVSLPPPDLRARFLARYPTPAAFTATAFKEFFGMAALHPALGFDPYADVEAKADKDPPGGAIRAGQQRTLLQWLRIGSVYPDLDRRNQDRWRVVNGQIARAPDGQRVPQDPVVLNMGGVEGLPGQAHAHYALNNHPKSDDPNVLKTRPADFAVRAGFPQAPVLTFAPQRAQAYCDLALIARQMNQPALAAVYAGSGFHYLGDAASPIHTIQVGIYDFFFDAKLQSWKVDLFTLWGLAGHTMDFRDIGIDILTNHHTWSEEYLRVALEHADAGKPLSPALAHSDDLFQTDPKIAAAGGGSVISMIDPIIAAGNVDGPEIYRLVREMTTSKLRQAGVRIDFDRRPESVVLSYLKPGQDQNLTRFFNLEKAGTRRGATAIALWWRTQFCADHQDLAAITARLLRQQLDELDQSDARRELWLRTHANR